MTKTFVLLGAIHGFLAVALGAFGAHALGDRLTTRMLEVYKTGVQYHMAHALALVLIGLLAERWPSNSLLRTAGWLFTAGIVLFSGSLYVLALTGVHVLGAITPFGGLCFLGGWLILAASATRSGT